MWKKPETQEPQSKPSSPNRSPVDQLKERAIIGPSISIKGELSGDEDLTIQGRVEGKVDLKKNNVTVGRSGRINADVYGKIISIEGEVEGNLFGEEKIIVRQTGVVRGNITAPRVNLEEGAKFKGSIDMESAGKQPSLPQTSVEAKTEPSTKTPLSAKDRKESSSQDSRQSQEIKLGVKTDTPSSKT